MIEKSRKRTFFIKKSFEDPKLKDWVSKVKGDKASASRKMFRSTINLPLLEKAGFNEAQLFFTS